MKLRTALLAATITILATLVIALLPVSTSNAGQAFTCGSALLPSDADAIRAGDAAVDRATGGMAAVDRSEPMSAVSELMDLSYTYADAEDAAVDACQQARGSRRTAVAGVGVAGLLAAVAAGVVARRRRASS